MGDAVTFDPAIHCLANTRWHPYPAYSKIADGVDQQSRDACRFASFNTTAANFTIRFASIGGNPFPFQVNTNGTGSAVFDTLESGADVRLIDGVTFSDIGSIALLQVCEVFKFKFIMSTQGSSSRLIAYLDWRDAENHLRLVISRTLVSFELLVDDEIAVLDQIESSAAGLNVAAGTNAFLFSSPVPDDSQRILGYGLHNNAGAPVGLTAPDAITHLFSTTHAAPPVSHGPALDCPDEPGISAFNFRGNARAVLCDPYVAAYDNAALLGYWSPRPQAPPGFVDRWNANAGRRRPVLYGSGLGFPPLLGHDSVNLW